MKKELMLCGVSMTALALIVLCVWKLDLLNPGRLYPEYDAVDDFEPDDEFSKNVMAEVEGDFWYRGSEKDGAGVLLYAFEYESDNPDSIVKLVHAVNEYYDLIDGKCRIWIADGPSGATIPMLTLSNYIDIDSQEYDRFGFCYLKVEYDEYKTDFLQTDIYIGIEGIKRAEIPDRLQEKAAEEGIDGYEVWPELEEIIVFETDK